MVDRQTLQNLPHLDMDAVIVSPSPHNLSPVDLQKRLLRLEDEMVKYLNGEHPHRSFRKAWGGLAKNFHRAVTQTRPTLMIIDPSQGSLTISHTSPYVAAKSLSSASLKTATLGSHQPFTAIKGQQFGFENIWEIIHDCHVSGIPSTVSPRVSERMAQMSMRHWNCLAKEFIQTTGDLLWSLMLDMLGMSFASNQDLPQYQEVRDILNDSLQQSLTAQLKEASRVCRLEVSYLGTRDNVTFTKARASIVTELQANHRRVQARMFLDEQEAESGNHTSGSERLAKMVAVMSKQLGVDPYQTEVDLMGTVIAYYDCASSRFVDTICRDIEGELFEGCRDSLYVKLRQWLTTLQPMALPPRSQPVTTFPQRGHTDA